MENLPLATVLLILNSGQSFMKTVKRYVSSYYVVVVVLLFYVHGKQLWSCRDDQLTLTTIFLGRLRPPKRLTSTSCTNFRQ